MNNNYKKYTFNRNFYKVVKIRKGVGFFMEIKHDLLPKQKTQKHNLRVEIDLYPYATELYEELDKIRIIERIREVPQLGVIKVTKKFAKTRFDYMMLQLYLHKLIKTHLQGDLRYTYNNYINSKEFKEDYVYINNKNKPSINLIDFQK